MLFNSVAFLFFLPLVVILYYAIPHRDRWALLLFASYVFYAWWKVSYLILIIFSTIVDFLLAKRISKTPKGWKRLSLLFLSLLSNIGVLFIFKYLVLFLPEGDVMIDNIYRVDHPIIGAIRYGIHYAIPVGISFYTFQTMSYTLDVYYDRIKPEKSLGKFALFVSFFPQLVAGPIERFANLMPQLKTQVKPLYANFANAFRLILFGFFVKICVADNLSPFVDAIFDQPTNYSSLTVVAGMFGFGLQIYADFAGYTLIAQGAALMLGIRLMDNFRAPYLATSIGNFWQRWHISLSTWFRDYVYYPLGGNRTGQLRWIFNILLVFAISGFWHGANYTFLIWGGMHGMIYLVERYLLPNRMLSKFHVFWNLIGGLRTFILVNIAWVFFRIDSLDRIPEFFGTMQQSKGQGIINISWWIWTMLALFVVLDVVLRKSRFDRWVGALETWQRWTIYLALLWCVMAWGGVANHPFIYFQF
ncbi:MAG: alginate O-acetyltransferase complex protein AlgI [Bacteroidia bacterium]